MKQAKLAFIGCCMIVAGLLSACGGGGAAATALPTFTPIPFYAAPTATEAPQVAVAATVVSSGGAENSEAITRGLGRYQALCLDCHGEAGVGTDKGSAVNALNLSEGEFVTFMRSGGELGTEHQFATNKLSEAGGKNLYIYLMSLKGS